jgi:hypothetical protein
MALHDLDRHSMPEDPIPYAAFRALEQRSMRKGRSLSNMAAFLVDPALEASKSATADRGSCRHRSRCHEKAGDQSRPAVQRDHGMHPPQPSSACLLTVPSRPDSLVCLGFCLLIKL